MTTHLARNVALALALVAGCGVQVLQEPEPSTIDGGTFAPPPIDAVELDAPRASDAPAPPPDARPCTGGNQNMMVGSDCYMLFTTKRSWVDANAACIAIDAQLAILDTAAKHDAAKTLAGIDNVWIGLTDLTVEGQFRWTDPAVPLVFTKWASSEPNNANGYFQEDCAIIAGVRAGDWDDRPCAPNMPGAPAGSGSYYYMCQF